MLAYYNVVLAFSTLTLAYHTDIDRIFYCAVSILYYDVNMLYCDDCSMLPRQVPLLSQKGMSR